MRARTFFIAAAALVAVAGCGGGGGSGGHATEAGGTQPKVVSGPLRLFAYSDGFDKQLIQPFEAENPKVAGIDGAVRSYVDLFYALA